MNRRDMLKRGALAATAAASAWHGVARAVTPVTPPRELRLDYAWYSPTSLVLKHFGWLEEDLKPQDVPVRWVLSAGSNRALEYLGSRSVDFGSTAGLAALLARANGNRVKAIYVFSRPEWTALVVAKNSPVTAIAQLKGQKIAATPGTDPYLFLLRALRQAGLDKRDVQIMPLQHADGRAALERGDVAAWAGLDPLMAASELQAGSRLIYRNVDFNTYGFLNVSEKFAATYPAHVTIVLRAYEKARLWAIAHPAELAQLVADESKLPLAVAQLQLKRNDFSQPLIGAMQRDALAAAAPILTEEGLTRPGVDVRAVLGSLIDPSYAQRAGVPA